MPDKPPIALDDSGYFAEFTIHGHTFEVDLSEASELLWKITAKHKADPHFCPACQEDWRPTEHEAKQERQLCPTCNAPGHAPQAWLDEVKQLVVDRWKAPRCSREGAAQFYNAVFDASEEVKKKNVTQPPLPFGTA